MSHLRSVACAVLFVACSSNHHDASPDANSNPPDAPDTGWAEAQHPSQPVVTSGGGNVLTAPVVVPVFFSNDADTQAQVESFLPMMAQSPYWTAITQEYGVGTLTIAPTVIATETPPTTDDTLQTIVDSHRTGTGGWPANTPNTIYAVFLPEGVTLTAGGTSCVDFGGYHAETNNGVVYALLPRCTSTKHPGLEYLTIATSHEVLEASTDPHPYSDPAYNEVDDDDAILGLMPGGELGDMCEVASAVYQPMVGSFYVQRTWSNASAAAGHDPCVPVLTTPYVEAAANLPEITIDAGGQFMTRGVVVPNGMSKTVEVDLYSDAPTNDWTVVAYDVASMYQMSAPELALTLDRTSGNNGDKLNLTIQRVAPASEFGVSEFVLFTQVDGVNTGMWFGLVSQ